jgi:GWxTD domain-containing protein
MAAAEESGFENIIIDNTFISSITDADTLADYIACLRPISNAMQTTWQDNQLKGANTKLMQQFFFNFWYNKNPQNPDESWQAYKAQVKAVDRYYGDKFTKGYTTERGRVYLQYGVPNSVNRNEHEPDAYPYEIWHYYKLKNQSNIKFVFYNPNLAGNDYRLLHSDANGELHNPNWNIELYKRNTNDNDFDNVKREQNFGNHSQETYDNPK